MYIVNVCWDASQKDINVLQYGSTVNVITGDAECRLYWYISDSTDTDDSMSVESQVPQDHRTTGLLLVTTIPAGLFIY